MNQKINYYRGEDCMKKFCKDLRENAMKIINYGKKSIVPLTTKEEICYNKQKYVVYVKEDLIIMIKSNKK